MKLTVKQLKRIGSGIQEMMYPDGEVRYRLTVALLKNFKPIEWKGYQSASIGDTIEMFQEDIKYKIDSDFLVLHEKNPSLKHRVLLKINSLGQGLKDRKLFRENRIQTKDRGVRVIAPIIELSRRYGPGRPGYYVFLNGFTRMKKCLFQFPWNFKV